MVGTHKPVLQMSKLRLRGLGVMGAWSQKWLLTAGAPLQLLVGMTSFHSAPPLSGIRGLGARSWVSPEQQRWGTKAHVRQEVDVAQGRVPRQGWAHSGIRTGVAREPWDTDTHRLRGLTWCRASALGVRLQGGGSQPRRGSMSLFRTPHSPAAVPGPLPAGRARTQPGTCLL